MAKNVVVVGTQWGDEGKGKIVDWLTDHAQGVVRFQGGHNAGHTLVIDGATYKLSLLPSGVVRGGKLSVIGNGVVVDPWHLLSEIEKIAGQQDENYNWNNSIVDLMKLLNLDSGLGARKQLAQELGYTGALDGSLKNAQFRTDKYFGFAVPTSVPGIEPHLLYPMKTWKDKAAFDETARKLVRMFQENFVKFEKHVDADVRSAAPEVRIAAE